MPTSHSSKRRKTQSRSVRTSQPHLRGRSPDGRTQAQASTAASAPSATASSAAANCTANPSSLTTKSLSASKIASRSPPAHPAHLLGLRARKAFSKTCPTSSYSIPQSAKPCPKSYHKYAVPQELYEKYGLRRYGAHGSSYRFVADETARFLGKDKKTCVWSLLTWAAALHYRRRQRRIARHQYGPDPLGRAGNGYAQRRHRSFRIRLSRRKRQYDHRPKSLKC